MRMNMERYAGWNKERYAGWNMERYAGCASKPDVYMVQWASLVCISIDFDRRQKTNPYLPDYV